MSPQQFDLTVFETYQTKDPAAPVTGTEIEGAVTVTVNWNADGTDVADGGVAFSDPAWAGPGKDPVLVYDEQIGGAKPIGTVAWKVTTQLLKVAETDTPGRRTRWAITPLTQLVRTFTPTGGDPQEPQVTYTASDTLRGAWMPKPAA